MSFGLSGQLTHRAMVGADVVVAWLDRTSGQGHAVDYYLQDSPRCSGGGGSCPDTELVSVDPELKCIRRSEAVKVALRCVQNRSRGHASTIVTKTTSCECLLIECVQRQFIIVLSLQLSTRYEY